MEHMITEAEREFCEGITSHENGNCCCMSCEPGFCFDCCHYCDFCVCELPPMVTPTAVDLSEPPF
jgi:hypothetical protein